jgi:hypothetical protein
MAADIFNDIVDGWIGFLKVSGEELDKQLARIISCNWPF